MKLTLALGAVTLAGCIIHDPEPPPPAELIDVMTITSNLDLLFVIDDSPTMADKQSSFQRALPALLAELSALEGGLPDLHIGVVSSDMGSSAHGDADPGPSVGQIGQGGCAGFGKHGDLLLGQAVLPDPADHFLVRDRSGNANFTGDLAETIALQTSLGSVGCGFEQPLAAMRAGLSSGREANAGFSRAGANLAVIALSDEDDCSLEHSTMLGPDGGPLGPLQSFRCFRFGVQCDQDSALVGTKTNCHPATNTEFVESTSPFATLLAGLKTDPLRVAFGAIVGVDTKVVVEQRTVNGTSQTVLAHSCTYLSASSGTEVGADPGVRFAALAHDLPRSDVESICSDDLSAQATKMGKLAAQLLSDHCLPRAVANCVVEDRSDLDPTFTETLNRCGGAPGNNCFDIVDDASCAATGQRLVVTHPIPGGPADVFSTLRCAP